MTKNSTANSDVVPFEFRGHSVRAVTILGEPWFVAADVCRVLDITNTTQTMQALDDDERSMFNIGRQGAANVINESGLYTLILRCRDAVKKGSKPHAFRKWVTAEVLPAIRKSGRFEDESGQMRPLVQVMIGPHGAQALSNVIRCRVAKLDSSHHRSAAMKLSSALHARFNVPRVEQIPVDQMEAACNFVASYAIEGEYLPKQDPGYRLNIHYPLDSLTCRRPEMLIDRGDGHAWLDVKISDLRENFRSPCEGLLCELHRAGYEVAGAWWEVRTLRNKLRELGSFAKGMTRAAEEPQRYAIKAGEMA